MIWKPKVYSSCQEASLSGLKYDYLIIATKVINVLNLVVQVEPCISRDSAICLIQNGTLEL